MNEALKKRAEEKLVLSKWFELYIISDINFIKLQQILVIILDKWNNQ